MIEGPLSGIKVVEFGQNLAGPYCGQILAFLGAEVTKIERPGGDDARRWGPPFVGEDAVIFTALNRGKTSVTCDLADPAQCEALIEMIGASDVFVHNLRADVPAKFGIDDATMRARFPKLVYANLGAFGHKGPWAQRPGYEPIIQAVAGLISLNGDPSGPPARVGVSIIDLSTGMWTAMGILAALYQRDQTGAGAIVDASLFETGLMWASTHLASFSVSGEVPPRQSTGHPSLAPYQVFECADGPLMICPGNERLWQKFVKVLGHEEWIEDPRFLTNRDRVAHREIIVGLVSDVMAPRPRAAWMEELSAVGVPNGPVNAIPEIMGIDQVAALGMFFQPDASSGAQFHGLPISFDHKRAGDAAPAPTIGAQIELPF